VPVKNGGQDITQLILDTLHEREPINTTEAFPTISQVEIKAALDRLKSRLMVEYTTIDREIVSLTAEGQAICDEGSHEYKVWDAIHKEGGIKLKDLVVSSILARM